MQAHLGILMLNPSWVSGNMSRSCSSTGSQSSATASRNIRVSRSTAWRGLDQSRIRSSAFPELIYDAACLHDGIPSDPSGVKGSGCGEQPRTSRPPNGRPEEFFPERNFSFLVYK